MIKFFSRHAAAYRYRYNRSFPILTHIVLLISIYIHDDCILSFYSLLSSKNINNVITNSPLRTPRINAIQLRLNQQFFRRLVKLLVIVIFSTWLTLLLTMAGDVHVNPGPGSTSTLESSLSDTLSYAHSVHNHLSFVHLNVQSIRHKLDVLYAELSNFDILAFSETWLNQSCQTEDILLHSFHNPERKDRFDDSHGGVIVYVKENIHFVRRYDLEINRLECIWIELVLHKNKHILFGVFYRPPSSDTIYNNLIEDSIGLAVDTNIADIIITGDFNYNALGPHRNILSITHQFNLEQLVTEPTHFTENSASILDLILVSNKNSILLSGVGEHFLEQDQRYHIPIYGLLKFNKPKNTSYDRHIWEYDRGDYESLRDAITKYNWENCTDNDINKYTSNVITQIINFAKTFIPNKIVKIRPSDVPWMNNDIRKRIRKRKRIYKKAITSNSPYQWNKFRQFRNSTILAIREAKLHYFKKISDNLKTGSPISKEWWTTLKSFISNQSKSTIPPLYNANTNQITSSNFEQANLLNDYFQHQTNIDDKNTDIPNLGPTLATSILSNIHLNPSDTENILKSLNVHKAVGPDGLSNRVLVEASHALSFPLCDLFNASLQHSIVPNMWKEAHVTAVFKKGDASLPSNYRPISLLNTVEKVFERLIFKHVYNHLRDNRFLTPVQSGFVPGDSTVNQLVSIYDTFCKALDNGLEVRVVFFDISKAFDKVWHQGLLRKIEFAGISGSLLKWFENYLSARRQRVVLPGVKSDWAFVKAGVPQGSILGPLLFLIFINDIVDEIRSCINLFADDTSLYIIVEQPDVAADLLQSDIQTISSWADKWLVTFNPAKSESLVISRKRNPSTHRSLQMLAQTIPEVNEHKHLGIFLSKDCKWHSHINYIVDKAWKRVNIMRKLKFSLDRLSLETIYISFIRPILEYADVVWSNCSKFELDQLDSIQNECARIASGATKLISIESLHKEISWETLSDRRYQHRLILFYKMKSNLTPDYLSSLVPASGDTRYILRNSENVNGVNARTTLYYNSFLPSAVRDWNLLSSDIRNSETLSIFKSKLKANKRCTPSYYYKGNRKLQVLHTRLRTNCSALNYHLFLKNISSSPLCQCGQLETTYHYFFECSFFNVSRQNLLHNLRDFHITLETLLFGNQALSDHDNMTIFLQVHSYIHDSKRFY